MLIESNVTYIDGLAYREFTDADYRRVKAEQDKFGATPSVSKELTKHSEVICDTISASDLQSQNFPPVRFVINRLLPVGLLLFAAPPKIGKSWMCLDAAIAVALGGQFLGSDCEQGDALFIGLEDSQRRLSERIGKLLPGQSWPQRLVLATKWPRADQGGLSKIREWAISVQKPTLVVIDVLTLFRAERRANSQVYEEDYRGIRPIQELAHELGIGIICVHHNRKQVSDDAFQMVSGSTAMTGAVDGTLLLLRGGAGIELHLQHRDIEGFEKAIQFDKWACRWTLLGDASEVRRTDERTAILNVLQEAGEAMTLSDIAAATEMQTGNAKQLLFKMAKSGEVKRAKRGSYLHPDFDSPVPPDNHDNQVTKTAKERPKTATIGYPVTEVIDGLGGAA